MTHSPSSNPLPPKIFYFGRGGSSCLAVELCPGNYAKVFVGNAKDEAIGPKATFDRNELYRLSQFFMSLWQEHGQEIFVSKLVDDPHDEILSHDLIMGNFEEAP